MANKVRLIDANVVEAALLDFRDVMCDTEPDDVFEECTYNVIMDCIRTMNAAPTINPDDLRPKGRWILEAHNERVNCRWNVTAECSECCDEKKEVWAGFFPGVPDSMAREISLMDAEQVKLSNYCPNCGAKMEG